MKSILKSIGYILFYMVFQMIIMSMVSMVVGTASGSKEQMEMFVNNNMMLLTVISNILTVIILILFIKLRKKSLSEELQAKRVDIRNYILPCVITFTYSMAFSLLGNDIANHSSFTRSTNNGRIYLQRNYFNETTQGTWGNGFDCVKCITFCISSYNGRRCGFSIGFIDSRCDIGSNLYKNKIFVTCNSSTYICKST